MAISSSIPTKASTNCILPTWWRNSRKAMPSCRGLISGHDALYDSVTEDGKLRLVFDMMGRMVPIDVDKRDVFSVVKKSRRRRRRRPNRRHRKVGGTDG